MMKPNKATIPLTSSNYNHEVAATGTAVTSTEAAKISAVDSQSPAAYVQDERYLQLKSAINHLAIETSEVIKSNRKHQLRHDSRERDIPIQESKEQKLLAIQRRLHRMRAEAALWGFLVETDSFWTVGP